MQLETLPSIAPRRNSGTTTSESNDTVSKNVRKTTDREDQEGPNRNRQGLSTGWNAERSDVVVEAPDNDWCRDIRDKGKRVVINGLPGTLDQRWVRLLGADCGVEQGHRGRMEGDDVKQIPP